MREKEKGICKIKREQERIIEDATSYRIHANMHTQRHMHVLQQYTGTKLQDFYIMIDDENI